MSTFLQNERVRQASFKLAAPYFTEAARSDGLYKGKLRPFCLPQPQADENLFSGIRREAITYFAGAGIKWHDGHDSLPSNHLCSSQVCCANFMFPFADQPDALAALLRPLFPSLDHMLPMEASTRYVAFEWIGEKNYLGEKVASDRGRTRGANCTSADAAVMFRRSDGQRQIALIEWKYTESYTSNPLAIASTGTDRRTIYQHLFARDDFPVRRDILPGFDALFYEPFYQLMRQQCLANEMERARELGADIVSVLHIAPAHNRDFQNVTSPALRSLGASAMQVWKRLASLPDRFTSVSTEMLFAPLLRSDAFPGLRAWREYLSARYDWVVD